ncbi:centrosomal protein of 131 kDa isoform X1 [Bombus terrestris]|uniref:Centrosomal protein of 131 kDa isoform X1 n=1 Tax=Bombus terrestris TaxID=30195 RepID=A0A9C6SPA9_BOMTE|nr:centrosomal protein of 131 kDa isoform X1 [Bombus terrestris]XP_048269420.1 centrosomal protein of 131 kDa isoform X1 [Bombus terrestris]XP_048269421.1 centrosomal protein of 131 kDa isoform X1 [Bombus terrestris]XP_048269422.1 centrosomal protein of 131 kDa isoform X1 [Bombus terrestris]XP_048269423.1 centrosomal protein of 131 kDa isoform X1 [Bombus terrestris]XP_048269424.1 centrosomal protein of 131 kDa isoform X1 [Bombus terrestris]
MINIDHPKIHGKPPVNKSLLSKYVESRQKKLTEENIMYERREINDDSNVIMEKMGNADCNQNFVESTACSFEKLCSMISDLEKDIAVTIPEIDQLQLKPEKDESEEKYVATGTVYDDLMSFLAKLEEGSLDDTKINIPEIDATTIFGEIFGNLQPLTNKTVVNYDSIVSAPSDSHYAFKEDLATAQLQLEEKNATISLLKEQLKTERRLACDRLESQRKSSASKLQQQDEKYKGIVKRHQKFIEQLISEKTDLTEKCNSLAQRVKEIEIKMQRDLKAATERHTVELQRAKEHFAAAEKIKRERWIEARTTKIKEMTVKGLEPELRNMTEQHAEEIQKLRNIHMKELQDTELRIIRHSNQQLEQLRLELIASHERMLANEKNILWTRYQEQLEEQESQFKGQQTKLFQELQRDRENFTKEQAKREAEMQASLQKNHSQYQSEVETLKQQHSNEKKTLEETLKAEWEAWLVNYKREQNLRIEQAESKIKEGCNKERDRQIELAIERLEKDFRNERSTLERNVDCKLRSLRDKYEMDLQTAIDNEQLHKTKLMQTKDKLEKTDVQLQHAENKLQEYVSELSNANEVIKRLSMERDNSKKLARQEIEGEKRELEEKIASLYHEITRINANRDTSMTQLHSRIKLIMTQKALTIKNLTKERDDVKLKCQHLEKLLDQQRREYILKTL